ncbi:MAG TPA: hypothetical protein VD908_19815 [Cytophagales bacterium]|nr:hypothetical protein [Cytophagales bacterium]
MILTSHSNLLFIYLEGAQSAENESSSNLENVIKERVIIKDFTKYVDNNFPMDFNPRAFLYKGKVILVGRSDEDILNLVNRIEKPKQITPTGEPIRATFGTNIEKYHILYKWSIKKYLKWTSKISFEFLSLIAGDEYCLKSDFDLLRDYILYAKDNDFIHSILFEDSKGFRVKRLTFDGWIGMGIKKPSSELKIPAFSTQKQNAHKVSLYTFNGYLVSTVQLFNIEPAQLILAGPGLELPDHYYIEYDIDNDSLTFFSNKKVENSIPRIVTAIADSDIIDMMKKT